MFVFDYNNIAFHVHLNLNLIIFDNIFIHLVLLFSIIDNIQSY